VRFAQCGDYFIGTVIGFFLLLIKIRQNEKYKITCDSRNRLFSSSAINAQVSVGVNIGLPSVVISGHYERGYEPQRRTVEYQRERVIYVDRL
jgi:hypothetical protein